MFRTCVLLALAYTLCASAQDQPTLRLDKRDLTVLGATIGVSSQVDVEKKVGKASSFRISQHEGSDEAICYRSVSEGDKTVVAFYFGALGGWTDLTRISISNSKTPRFPAARCKPSGLISHDLAFLRGLRLGASTTDVMRVLGPPSRSTEGTLSYYVSHNCPPEFLPKKSSGEPDTDAPCEVVDSVEAQFGPEVGLDYISFYHFVDR